MAKRTTTSRRLAVHVARVCAENRCRDVAVLDLRRLSPVTEFFVVATGTSSRQMSAAARYVADGGKALGDAPFGVEGVETSDATAAIRWVLIDFVDVVVHLFSDASRGYYDLELLWGDAPRVDWQKGWKPREDAGDAG
ncbi:MAG: ribosome silencing factor [Planctomycetes bacterium]|nr:ribosome silencing factor [Planctomycetota bacterium]